jgi:hypothetical protein
MISAEFQPSIINPPGVVHTEDPYVLLEIWRRDPSNMYRLPCVNWDRSDSQVCDWKHLGANIVGLTGVRSLANATLTTTKEVNSDGLYWVLVRCLRQPIHSNKYVSLSIDDTLISKINTLTPYGEHYRYLDFGYVNLTQGTHEFQIDLDGKDAWVDHVLLYKLDYYASDNRDSSVRLDWTSIEFTENAMGDINMADITLPLREEWHDPNLNIFSRKVFDFGDILNISVGSDWNDARVKFGGYIGSISEEDDGTSMNIGAVDRLVDFYRKPNYANYFIGVAASSDDNYMFPVVQFPTALEAIRHSSETCEYGPLNYGIIYPYTLDLNFKRPEDAALVTATGFTKTYSPSTGLRIGYDKLPVNSCGVTPDLSCVLTLYDRPDKPVDAAVDETLCLTYMAAGESCGAQTSVQFNIEVTMYKAGEDEGDAVTYTILFTGKSGATNIIGQGTPILNGLEQMLKFDLKSAFDKYAPSSEYNVIKIELTDTLTSTQALNRQNSTIHLISLIGYDMDINTKMELAQETSYPYENITAILEKMGYVAWVEYGRTRATDVFMVAPEMNGASTVIAQEGVNVLGVTDKNYAPYDNIRNRRLSHYHYKEGDTERTGVSMVENLDSVLRYGPGAWESYEDQTEISNQADADTENRRFIDANSYPATSFTLTIKGASLLNPSQYIISKLAQHHLSGDYSTKTVTHTITRDEGYLSKISVNRPGRYYEKIRNRVEKRILKYMGLNSRSMYSQTALANMGFSGVGAFERSGY